MLQQHGQAADEKLYKIRHSPWNQVARAAEEFAHVYMSHYRVPALKMRATVTYVLRAVSGFDCLHAVEAADG